MPSTMNMLQKSKYGPTEQQIHQLCINQHLPDPQKPDKKDVFVPVKHFYFHVTNIGELVWRVYD